MEYYNNLTINFNNRKSAGIAKDLAVAALRDGNFDEMYARTPSERMSSDLKVENENLILDGSDGYFTPEDIEDVMTAMLVSIAQGLSNEYFHFESDTPSTYGETVIEGDFKNGKLTIDSIYYPMGYVEDLVCPECVAIIDTVQNYDSRKHYVCPVCGEELDFSDEAPVYNTSIIRIA